MNGHMTIFLKEVRLYGFHGVFEEEHRTGGEFVLDVTVRLKKLAAAWQLTDTVDYSAVFAVVKAVFAQREALLETVANNICNKIFAEQDAAQAITVTITKLKAPIAGLDGHTGVTLYRERMH